MDGLLAIGGEYDGTRSAPVVTLSQVQTVYGSLTTAIVVLLSLALAAIVLLFGAQVIAEYERMERKASVKLG